MMAVGKRPRSIAVSIFALVIGSVLVMAAAFLAASFMGPPPRPAPEMMENIAQVLRTGKKLPRGTMVRPHWAEKWPDSFSAGAARRLGSPPLDSPPGELGRGFGLDRPHHFMMRQPRTLEFGLSTSAPQPRRGERFDAPLATEVAETLHVPVQTVTAYRDERMVFAPGAVAGNFTIGVLYKGRWRIVLTEAQPLVSAWQLTMLAAVLGAMLLLAGPAWLIARAISKPLRQLGETAAVARAGAPLGPVPQGGAAEVRDLTRSVSAMHDRLARHAEGRTAMLAAISHDLGTPLARLAFWIEQLPEDARHRASADIDEMRAMIGAALRFARDDASAHLDQRIDLGSLLESLADDMQGAGGTVTAEPGPRAIVRGDPTGLRRLFANLIENAVRYGDMATLSWHPRGGTVDIFIDDQGPGFDPALAERLFEPFVRGDPSRNRETGGTGLGLAIVRSLAEVHRGTVSLERGPKGGRVRVRLPLDLP